MDALGESLVRLFDISTSTLFSGLRGGGVLSAGVVDYLLRFVLLPIHKKEKCKCLQGCGVACRKSSRVGGNN